MFICAYTKLAQANSPLFGQIKCSIHLHGRRICNTTNQLGIGSSPPAGEMNVLVLFISDTILRSHKQAGYAVPLPGTTYTVKVT